MICFTFVYIVGADAVSILSEMVSQCNVRERINPDEETWPPDQLRNFTPLVLIYHQRRNTMKQATARVQLIQTGDIDKITSLTRSQAVPKGQRHPNSHNYRLLREAFDNSTITKEFWEVLALLEQSKTPQFILIEGAPGMGKSMLLREIAYMWGEKKLLKAFKLVFLVCLRNPGVQQMQSVSDLLQHFCEGNSRSKEIAAACYDYLSKDGGKDVVLLLDGFDEFPVQENSFVLQLLNRKDLPNCGLVISSRPHATVYLRERATVRVDILGFTEVEQNQFIQQALKEQPQSIEELTQYLDKHFSMRSLCVAPFNMVVLLFLYEQGISHTKNSTELYNHLICLTICRHLAKHGYPLDNTITDLTNLPDSCISIIQQLSKLSLEALNNNKWDFTYDEIKEACPDIETIKGAINGFGLLRAVQHFGPTGKTMTFKFFHNSVQEFLAAYHLTTLPPSKELKILKDNFWNDSYSNAFAIYISLTKGKRSSFKQFIKPSLGQRIVGFFKGEEVTISDQFLDTNLKCFHLFRCFFEAGNVEMCASIETAKIFDSKIITLWNARLSPSDVECLAVFLTYSSHKEWEELNLCGCYIQDHGVHILRLGIKSCRDVTISTLHLGYNGLTEFSSSAISDITIGCGVKQLSIRGNKTVGEDEKLYSIISDPSSMLEILHMQCINLSLNALIKLFTALGESRKLRELYISSNINDITDEACDTIIMAMKKNTSLVELFVQDTPISGERALLIVEGLKHNDTLQKLCLPFGYQQYTKDGIRLSVEEINKKREDCGCQVLEIDYA